MSTVNPGDTVYKNKTTGQYYLSNGEGYSPGKAGGALLSSGQVTVNEFDDETKSPWYIDPKQTYYKTAGTDTGSLSTYSYGGQTATPGEYYYKDANGVLQAANSGVYKAIQNGTLKAQDLAFDNPEDKIKDANITAGRPANFSEQNGDVYSLIDDKGQVHNVQTLNGRDGAIAILKQRGINVVGDAPDQTSTEDLAHPSPNINYGNENDGVAGKQHAQNGTTPTGGGQQDPKQAPQDGMLSSADAGMMPGAQDVSTQGGQAQGGGQTDIITDPVTGRSYSRDLSIPGSTYQPYNGQIPNAPANTIAPSGYVNTPLDANQPSTLDTLLSNYGYTLSTAASERFKVSPAASFQEVYSSVLSSTQFSLGMKGRKTATDKITKLDQELADKLADVNENPWLTEGVRVTESRKLQERYELKTAAYKSDLLLYEKITNDAREEARYVATQSLQQYNTERQFQLDQIQSMQDEAEKFFEAKLDVYKEKNKAPDYAPGSIGEYQFAVSQGYDGSFSDYQNEDANRKISIARAGVGSGSGLTPYQENQAFLTISNKYQADPLINVALKGATAVTIADQIIADPKTATSQLKSLYVLVKNLDPDSAVREGELALANQTQSYLQTWGNSLARVSEGRVIDPKAAVALAQATKELATAWNQTAARRQKQYQAQAQVGNVGDQFNQYVNTAGNDFGAGGANDPDPLGLR